LVCLSYPEITPPSNFQHVLDTTSHSEGWLGLGALRRALLRRGPAPGLIHHANRGSQYCSDDYMAMLKAHSIIISMSGKGNCFDNAMVETVCKTIKADLIWRTLIQSRHQAEYALGRSIDALNNPVRRHAALGYVSPIAFEAAARKTEAVSLQ